jgi:hypothetical protein
MLAVDVYSRMELCTPTWLYHDYGDGELVDILAVDAYSGVEVCSSIFLGEASKTKLGSKPFKKNSKHKWAHPITKLNTNKSCYVDNIWLW